MEKPSTMSVKEWIIKKMSISMVISEKTIDQVINHQFDSANDALNTNDTIEISGFGKFLFNNKKAIKKLEALHAKVIAMERILADDTITEQRRNAATVTLANTHIAINQLKPKLRYD